MAEEIFIGSGSDQIQYNTEQSIAFKAKVSANNSPYDVDIETREGNGNWRKAIESTRTIQNQDENIIATGNIADEVRVTITNNSGNSAYVTVEPFFKNDTDGLFEFLSEQPSRLNRTVPLTFYNGKKVGISESENADSLSTGKPSTSLTTSAKLTVNVPNDYATIQDAVDAIPRLLRHYVEIEISEGTYNENVLVGGRIGMDQIAAPGSDSQSGHADGTLSFRSATGDAADVTVSSIYLGGVQHRVRINSLTLDGNTPYEDNGYAATFRDCQEVICSGMEFNTSAGIGGLEYYATDGDVRETDFSGVADDGLLAKRGSIVNVHDNMTHGAGSNDYAATAAGVLRLHKVTGYNYASDVYIDNSGVFQDGDRSILAISNGSQVRRAIYPQASVFGRVQSQLSPEYDSLASCPGWTAADGGVSSWNNRLDSRPRKLYVEHDGSGGSNDYGGIHSPVLVTEQTLNENGSDGFRVTFPKVTFSDNSQDFTLGLSTVTADTRIRTNGDGFYMLATGGSDLDLGVVTGGTETVEDGPAIDWSTDHDIALEYDGEEVKMYLDPPASAAATATYSTHADFRPVVQLRENNSSADGETGSTAIPKVEPL